MKCLIDENTLPGILEARTELVKEIAAQIQTFKEVLNPEQLRTFNVIDDLHQLQISTAQQDTLENIHCLTCRNKEKCQK